MEKLSYNTYPDSTESSPRSRDVDFDNTPPWDDQNYKVRFMCSYNGKIQPRPHDNQLTYVNGETKILSVDRGIRFPVLASKLSAVCGGDSGGDVLFKYQLPGEDLDALITVSNDDDLEHMMHEYDRLVRVSSKPARMRLFLFPVTSGGFGSEGSGSDRFVEVLNTVRSQPEPEKVATAPPPPPPLHEVPKFSDPALLQPDHGVHPAEMQRQMHEFQRMQLRDQEQQEAVYRRKSEDGLLETGGYFSPPYAPPPSPQPTIPQTNTQAPPMTYWQGNHNNQGGVYPTTIPEQPVYMVPSPQPGNVYHAPPPQQGVMRPVTTGQGGYYPQVQREQAYNVAQPAKTQQQQHQQQPPLSFNSGPPPSPPQYSAVPPPRQVVGLPDTSAYSQVTYPRGMGKQVYYTEAPPPPQYHGVGLVSGMNEMRTGPDGRHVPMNNMGPKVSSHNSDSAV